MHAPVSSAPDARVPRPLPPGPKGLPFFGSLFELLADPLGFLTERPRDYGDVVRFRFPRTTYIVVNDPDAIHHVIVDRAENYPKSRQYDGLRLFLGNGLVTSEGAFWRRQRKLVQPAFHPKKIGAFAPAMVRAGEVLLARWEDHARSGRSFDVADEMQRVTFQIAGETLFSINLDDSSQAMGKAMAIAQRYANDYVTTPFRIPRSIPTRKNREFDLALRTLDGIVYRILEERRSGDAHDDLLSMLVRARDEETGEGMSAEQLRDEIVTLISAGHETTANGLAWTFYLLARNPDVDARLAREVREVLGDRPPTLADLPRMPYVRWTFEEAMRLYPPVWGFEREALEEDEILGYRIPKGASVGVLTYALHRHPRFWPEPETFDPERFSPERSEGRHRYAYLPFGGGPRICIGNGFALMEAQLLLAQIVQRYRLELDRAHPVEIEPLITLRPKHGIFTRLVAR
ncbi:MAG: cytochrome P450 [Polyangiales bacterium]